MIDDEPPVFRANDHLPLLPVISTANVIDSFFPAEVYYPAR